MTLETVQKNPNSPQAQSAEVPSYRHESGTLDRLTIKPDGIILADDSDCCLEVLMKAQRVNLESAAHVGVTDRSAPSGIEFLGVYNAGNRYYPIASFLYNKMGSDGSLETDRRVVIVTGWGNGVHPGHEGQDPARYLVGIQIGVKNEEGFQVSEAVLGAETLAKNFSLDCMVNGLRGDSVVLANRH